MNYSKLPRSIALSILAMSTGIAHSAEQTAATTDQTAAAIDWVVDTSGTYLCQGYYRSPFVEGARGEDLNAEAEHTDYDGDDRVILNGNVFVSRNDFQLEADRVSFLASTGDGDAEGNVKIRRPNSLLVGDTASVNVRTNAFDLKNSSFVTHQNRLRGESEFAIGAPGICRRTRFIWINLPGADGRAMLSYASKRFRCFTLRLWVFPSMIGV